MCMKYEHMCFLFSLVYAINFNDDKKQMNYGPEVVWGAQINSDPLNLRGQILFNPAIRHAVLLLGKGK